MGSRISRAEDIAGMSFSISQLWMKANYMCHRHLRPHAADGARLVDDHRHLGHRPADAPWDRARRQRDRDRHGGQYGGSLRRAVGSAAPLSSLASPLLFDTDGGGQTMRAIALI